MAVDVPSEGTRTFPFSAIVGQDLLKLALLLNAVDPRIGGVLIRGEKGTAKSTAVRALTAVMPPISVVAGCRFSCDPADPAGRCDECRARRADGALPKAQRRASLVELPVSATEDRLVGTLDFEHALKHGERRFEPGLLARANRSILYVDEVNLLDDHLVDTLLDAAAMGVNTVEREGVSFRHPAKFVLVGTMNPEEGDLRPQLLDRFGLCVDVVGEREPAARVEIVRRRRDFDADPAAFTRKWADSEALLRTRIRSAQVLVSHVEVSDELLFAIANLALTVGVDGHRADQAMARAAAASAALDGRGVATTADVERVAPLVLVHRTRRTLFDEPRLDSTALASLIASSLSESAADEGEDPADQPGGAGLGQAAIWEPSRAEPAESSASGVQGADLVNPMDRTARATAGRTQASLSSDSRGRYARSRPATGELSASDVAMDATVRNAAAAQSARSSADGGLAINIDRSSLHEKVRTRKVGATIVFCVDASGSMGAAERVSATRDAMLDLLKDAYQRRDRVALVTFRGDGASVVLAPTASIQLAQMRLRTLPTGGATPIAAGILTSLDVLEQEKRRDADTVPWMVIVTDGRANVGIDGGQGSSDALTAARRVAASGVHTLVVDVSGPSSGGDHGRELASATGGQYVKIGDGGHNTLLTAVRTRIARP